MENEEKKEQVSIPFLMDHMSENNRRMFVALLTVCVTFIITIVVFVVGYTIRERNWLHTISHMTPVTTEVADGIHEQSSP